MWGFLKICGVFSETTSFKSYGVICLPTASYSDIAAVFCATFRRQSLLKLLNTTWNTSQCKAASFFLFSLCLLPTDLLYTFRYTHFSSACFSGFMYVCRLEFCTLVHSLFLYHWFYCDVATHTVIQGSCTLQYK